MAVVSLQGDVFEVLGELPELEKHAPDFCLADQNLNDVTLDNFAGRRVILNIFPSVDTAVCATSVRKFNEKVSSIGSGKIVVASISKDLPFAFKRFCASEGLPNIITLSAFRSPDFGKTWGVEIAEGPFKGLLARSVIIVDETKRVIYTELVDELSHEPDYDMAIKAVTYDF